MSKDSSAPAFPSDSNEFGAVLGMSLRDYFAAKAACGLCSNQKWLENSKLKIEDTTLAVACASYEIADAMLAGGWRTQHADCAIKARQAKQDNQ